METSAPQRRGVTRPSLSLTFAPIQLAVLTFVAGIGSAALLLGEHVTGIELAGSTLVFAGLLVNVFGPRLRMRKPA